jgi:hypothetical protein
MIRMELGKAKCISGMRREEEKKKQESFFI